MKKYFAGIVLVFLCFCWLNAQNSIFLGGSNNLGGGTNVFAGYQLTNKAGIILNYYKRDIVSVDFLYNGFVVSNGFGLDQTPEKRFTTLLYAPGIVKLGERWKIFGKIGIDFSGPLNKINKDKINSIFGIGLRWN